MAITEKEKFNGNLNEIISCVGKAMLWIGLFWVTLFVVSFFVSSSYQGNTDKRYLILGITCLILIGIFVMKGVFKIIHELYLKFYYSY